MLAHQSPEPCLQRNAVQAPGYRLVHAAVERQPDLRGLGNQAKHCIQARVLDLRWLAPLPVDDLVRAASATGRLFIADETRRSGGVGEGIIAEVIDAGFTGPIARVSSRDSFVPLGDAAELVLLSEDDIVAGVIAMMGAPG